ncbi:MULTISPECIES: HAD family hydrolase [unclassified Synechococcus]|jgi:phosphoglycolate phosphatase-like HAD superfamily hydrolase|uniref:HAD family hydrolase n=1 Tax=unclassified Synechococcus TaxID=2626047 RepID=UPI00200136E5|nr:HAD family hydrolase [Synechococcus sp. A10-1-5-1]UPM51344.1 HAD family hydrolase [Synechococcus sp. A10-1-5-1]
MSLQPLLVFDFDGVLVDGMREYWWSARRAALFLSPQCQLPELAPEAFSALRPLIHKGWEMVLVALELSRSDLDVAHYLSDYDDHTQSALNRWGFPAEQLQSALENLRSDAIQQDTPAWRALHSPYPGVPERLRALEAEGSPWLVLTTKGGEFARELLTGYGLQPQAVYGHEQGTKPEVLLRLREQGRPLWFVEDRRVTLETVRSTPGLEAVRCFLVSWGYLGPLDRERLPDGITLLEPEGFAEPLAHWP